MQIHVRIFVPTRFIKVYNVAQMKINTQITKPQNLYQFDNSISNIYSNLIKCLLVKINQCLHTIDRERVFSPNRSSEELRCFTLIG